MNYKVWRVFHLNYKFKVGFFCEITRFCGLFLGNYKFWRVFSAILLYIVWRRVLKQNGFFSSFFVVTSRIFFSQKTASFPRLFFLENSSFRLRVIYFATPSLRSSAFVTLACANLFVGIITTVTTFVLENFDDEELKAIGSVLKVQYSQGTKCTCRLLLNRKMKNKRNKKKV